MIESLGFKIDTKAFLGALCVFLLIPPGVIGVPRQFIIAQYGLLILLLINFDSKIFTKSSDGLFSVIMTLLYLSIAFHSRDLSFKGFVYTVSLSLMMWAKKSYIKSVFDAFTQIYVYLLLPSLIVYILFFAGVPLPHSYWSLDDATSYTIVDIYAKICGVSSLRFCGYFQEPGVVGTVSAIILIAYRFHIKPLYLIVLIGSGIASFSFAFFAIIGMYAIFCSRSWKVILGTALILGILYYFFYDLLDELVLYKFAFNDGSLDFNRTKGDFNSWYENFKMTDAYLWGLGGGTAIIYNWGGASYKDLIVDYGLVFFIIYVSSFALYAKHAIRSFFPWVAYLLILIVVLFQRPFIVLPTYVLLLYAPILVLKANQLAETPTNSGTPPWYYFLFNTKNIKSTKNIEQ